MLYGPADALELPLHQVRRPWPAVRVDLAREFGCLVSGHALTPSPGGRGPDKLHGLLVVGGAFLLSLGISLWAKRTSEPEQGRPPAPPTTQGIVGWPNAIEPIATLSAARELTRRSLLRGMVIDGVKSDGTVDLKAPGAGVRYAFQSLPGQGPQPARVPGVVPRRNLCGRQNVELRAKGLYAAPDQLDAPCLPAQTDPLPEPRCELKELWEQAVHKGAKPRQRARIEYYRAIAGPAWRFELQDGSLSFAIYGDCRRELSHGEATGSVP
jgi:hypothetical protein